jgi:2-polyprenyl-6-methoxyphenol hydroxylase-like FAD-dependent oxidoreductase
MTDLARTRSDAERSAPHPASRHALIVGAGIGGLTAAVALRTIGWRATILERNLQLQEVGAGISLWPNAVHALTALGLRRALDAVSVIQQHAMVYTWQGAPLGPSLGAQFEAEFGAPLVTMHRAALQKLLIAAAGADSLMLNSTCAAVELDVDRARARLHDGSTADGDILIGADGIHSTVRRAIFGHTSSTYTDYTAWRGVVPVDDALRPRIATGEFLGPGSLFGIATLGGSQVYWWASRRCPERDRARPELEKNQLMQHWGRWADPIPDLLDATPAEAIIRTPLHALPPLRTLSLGRIALIGDAAHPMLPHLGQGACQAIEGAVELAAALTAQTDPAAALSRYGVRRARRTASVVRKTQQVARIAHLRNPLVASLRNAALRATSPLQRNQAHPPNRRLRRHRRSGHRERHG